jgi:hypothetical protein
MIWKNETEHILSGIKYLNVVEIENPEYYILNMKKILKK